MRRAVVSQVAPPTRALRSRSWLIWCSEGVTAPSPVGKCRINTAKTSIQIVFCMNCRPGTQATAQNTPMPTSSPGTARGYIAMNSSGRRNSQSERVETMAVAATSTVPIAPTTSATATVLPIERTYSGNATSAR